MALPQADQQGEELDYQIGKIPVRWIYQGDGTWAKQIADSGSSAMITNYAYDGATPTSHLIYEGWAIPGSVNSDAVWRIVAYTYSGDSVISKRFATGNTKFDKVWDNRALYTYS